MIYPKDIYMSPRKAMERFSQIMKRCHPEAIHIGNNYRLEKEALIAAEFLYGIEELFGGKYWLRNAEDIAKDIDIKVVSDTGTASYIQLVEFEAHRDTFIDVVKTKQKPGYEPGQLELVINMRDKRGWTFIPATLAEEVKKIKPTYTAIWLLTDDASGEWKFHLIRLHPKPAQTTFRIPDKFDTSTPPDWRKESPKYGSNTLEKGEFDLPLPPCPKCGKQ